MIPLETPSKNNQIIPLTLKNSPPAGGPDCAGDENGSPPKSPSKSMAVEPEDFEDCRL